MPHINLTILRNFRISVPDLPTQQRIADILAAYDDFIENNNQRMALLEESVHLLYREWFVRLRFPGHERVKVIDGVPEGWKWTTLGDYAPLIHGKSLPEKIRLPGDVPVYGSSGIVGTHDRALVEGPGIVVGRKGNVGSVFWSSRSFFPIDTVFYVPRERTNEFLYQTLHSLNFINSDAAVPGLNRNIAHAQRFLEPSGTVLNEFEDFVRPIRRMRDNLQLNNARLAEGRDTLLPRLMNGSISV